jgi:uncharacterized membrane protein (DUF485 family)
MGERMGELASQTGRKVMAAGVLLLAAYVLFKLVIGFITSVALIAVAVLAVVAVIWALRVL